MTALKDRIADLETALKRVRKRYHKLAGGVG